MRSSMVALIILLAAGAPAPAASRSGQGFDWRLWRGLPVQAGGRQKPLDTLARETVREITGRTGLTDPETDQELGPVALYLTMLLEWQGWDEKPSDPHSTAMMHSRMNYFESHEADKWDRAPLIPVDPVLREALGIDQDQRHISPLELSEARVKDPHTGREVSFVPWAGKLVRADR